MIKDWEFLGADLLSNRELLSVPKMNGHFIYENDYKNDTDDLHAFLFKWQEKWLSNWEITEGTKSSFPWSYRYERGGHINTSVRDISMRESTSFRYESSRYESEDPIISIRQPRVISIWVLPIRNLKRIRKKSVWFHLDKRGDISVMYPKGICKSYQYDRSSIISKWGRISSYQSERESNHINRRAGGHINQTAATMCPWVIHKESIRFGISIRERLRWIRKKSIKNP